MNDTDLAKASEELEELQEELISAFQNKRIWALASVVLSLWLVPYGWTAFSVGVAMCWAGGKWFKYYALHQVVEHQVWVSASAREELNKLNSPAEDD